MDLNFIKINLTPYLEFFDIHYLSKCNKKMYDAYINDSIELMLPFVIKKYELHVFETQYNDNNVNDLLRKVRYFYSYPYSYEEAKKDDMKIFKQRHKVNLNNEYDLENFWYYISKVSNPQNSLKFLHRFKNLLSDKLWEYLL